MVALCNTPGALQAAACQRMVGHPVLDWKAIHSSEVRILLAKRNGGSLARQLMNRHSLTWLPLLLDTRLSWRVHVVIYLYSSLLSYILVSRRLLNRPTKSSTYVNVEAKPNNHAALARLKSELHLRSPKHRCFPSHLSFFPSHGRVPDARHARTRYGQPNSQNPAPAVPSSRGLHSSPALSAPFLIGLTVSHTRIGERRRQRLKSWLISCVKICANNILSTPREAYHLLNESTRIFKKYMANNQPEYERLLGFMKALRKNARGRTTAGLARGHWMRSSG
jgi:hypothetical protein